jgi:hypothetical protein
MANCFLMDDDGDIMTRNGDLVLGDVDGQATKIILLACEGQMRHAPLHGAGIRRAVLTKGNPVSMLHKIQQKLKLDKADVNGVRWIGTEIVADATWNV